MPNFHHLAPGITCHAWNKDKSMLAICPNTNEIWIYSGCQSASVAQWRKEFVLKEVRSVIYGHIDNPFNLIEQTNALLRLLPYSMI